MLARRLGGGEGDISVIVFFLNVRRRAGAAVGVIRDGINLFKTEGHVVGCGEIIILDREQIGLTGFELLLKAELVRLLAETRVAVIVAGVREVCAGVIGFGFVVHAVGIHSAQTVAEIGLCDGRRELIKRDLALRADLCSIGSIRHKHRRVRRIPKGVIGRIGGRNGDRIRCHIRFCFLAVLRGGPRDELVLRAGEAGFIQPDALPLRKRLRKGGSAAGGVEGDVSAVCQNNGIVAGRTVVVMPRAEVILGPGVERLYDIMPVPRQIQQGLRLRRAVGAAGNVVLIGDLIPRAVDDIPLGVAVGALRLKDIGPGSGRREGEPRAGGPGGKARGGLGVQRDRGHGVRNRLDGVGSVIDIRLRIGGVAVVKIRKDRRRGIQRGIQRGGIVRRNLVDLFAPLIPRAQGVGTHLIRAGGLEEQENIVAAGVSVHIGGRPDVVRGVAGALDRRPSALRRAGCVFEPGDRRTRRRVLTDVKVNIVAAAVLVQVDDAVAVAVAAGGGILAHDGERAALTVDRLIFRRLIVVGAAGIDHDAGGGFGDGGTFLEAETDIFAAGSVVQVLVDDVVIAVAGHGAFCGRPDLAPAGRKVCDEIGSAIIMPLLGVVLRVIVIRLYGRRKQHGEHGNHGEDQNKGKQRQQHLAPTGDWVLCGCCSAHQAYTPYKDFYSIK